MNDKIHQLASDFPAGNDAIWRELAQKAIKDADFDETLVKHTEDGIPRGPLFTASQTTETTPLHKQDNPQLAGRSWHIGCISDHPEIKTANADLLEDLKGGASSVLIDLGSTSKPGVTLRTKSDVQRLLANVHCDLVPIGLLPSEDNFEAAALLASHFKSDPKLKDVYVALGYAPLGLRGEDTTKIENIAEWVQAHATHWKALSVNAKLAHEAGGSPAQELALMLALGRTYIQTLLDAGHTIEAALAMIDIHLASDQDGHQGIIKFRAARLLWAKLAESFGASENARNCHIHAISSERMMAKQDPWSNMIRLSAASFGAVCGGADTITLLPFTHALGLATPFARRISRNMQLMMMEESYLGQVNDPAHGSYMHERLSTDLAKKSWQIFQQIEELGGWAETKAQNWLLTEITNTHATRMQNIESGDIKLVGVNQFAKPDVRKAEVRRRPTIKPKSGEYITGPSFEDAIKQADDGHLAPERDNGSHFPKVRLSENFDNSGDA
jgi:methylmalonyl-CoA mutase